MNHNHNHNHSHSHQLTKNIKTAFLLNFGFAILEIFGGLWTNSLAITSDAIHDLGDSFSLGLAWYLEKKSNQTNNHLFSYGYRRLSLLAALINTLILLFGSLYVLSEAIPRIINPEPTNARGMIFFAIIGIIINGSAMIKLSHQSSLNAKVVAWHLWEDVLGWVAVLIVSIVLLFSNLYILDPILSILISVYILYNAIANLRKTVTLFLQAVPENINLEQLEATIIALDRVDSIHHTHVWSLDGEHHVLTTHVVVMDNTSRKAIQSIKNAIKHLGHDLNLEHITVEIEYLSEYCSMRV
ncbi:cation transporter [Waterburya agarophytonicola K14]|uniref:Cation transporter n=1 Tax=Waterburya agarophytonicola KI4 TaxID=2874699 RepID=A0A964FFE0_9CYAN|nr:cation diffusion facilitator family transporter [Waterburya agarophytonicola]MCC0176816.1 cation transporter [Waterburya agarophytonicola KI4]